jgi:hypothetical protein
MDSLPAFVLELWEADAWNELHPNGPKKSVLLTHAQLKWLNDNGPQTPPAEPIAFKPTIRDVGPVTMHF